MEHLDRRSLLGVAGMVGVAALASRAGAGPLAPPAGPVVPTGRTLDELYDRTAQAERYGRPSTPIGADTTPGDETNLRVITQPGHYHLTGNLVVPPEFATGINVAAPGVTINLNGFAVIGSPGVSQSAVNGGPLATTVTNGMISQFVNGFGLSFSPTESARVESVAFDRCTIAVWTSDFPIVRGCSFTRCAQIALRAGMGGIITGCTFNRCGAGVELNACILEGCTFFSPRRAVAVAAANGSIVRGCSINAAFNDGAGPDVTPVTLSENSRMEHCVLTADCRITPLRVSGASVVSHCTLRNLTPDTSGGITQVEITDASIMQDSLIRRSDNGGGITAVVGAACVFKGNTIVGRGLVTTTVTGSPRGAVLANTAFTGGNFIGSFDTGLIQAPVHLAANNPSMPAGFSGFGNVLGS